LLDDCRGYLKTWAQRQLNSRLGVRIDASNIVQQTFLLAHREFGQFRGVQVGELIAWLVRILERTVQQAVREHVTTQCRALGREQPRDGRNAITLEGKDDSPSRWAKRQFIWPIA
jgi:RNA polymerase sigma-70 factor (ECF subfamily)